MEENGSTADKKAHEDTDKRNGANKQKETRDKDAERKRRQKSKKKQVQWIVLTKMDDKRHVSKAIHSNSDGGGKKRRKAKRKGETTEPMMNENPLVAKATTDSEVSCPTLVSLLAELINDFCK